MHVECKSDGHVYRRIKIIRRGACTRCRLRFPWRWSLSPGIGTGCGTWSEFSRRSRRRRHILRYVKYTIGAESALREFSRRMKREKNRRCSVKEMEIEYFPGFPEKGARGRRRNPPEVTFQGKYGTLHFFLPSNYIIRSGFNKRGRGGGGEGRGGGREGLTRPGNPPPSAPASHATERNMAAGEIKSNRSSTWDRGCHCYCNRPSHLPVKVSESYNNKSRLRTGTGEAFGNVAAFPGEMQ